MPSISPIHSQRQAESSEAVNDAINESLVDNIAQAGQGDDEDGTTHKTGAHAGKGGKKAHIGLGAHHASPSAGGGHPQGGDGVDAGSNQSHAPTGSNNGDSDPLGQRVETQSNNAPNTEHFHEISDLAATPSGDASQGRASGGKTTSGTQNVSTSGTNQASDSKGTQQATGKSSPSSTTGTSSATATADQSAQSAQTQLSQVLASPSATTSQVNKATDKFISAMRADGASDDQISSKLTQLTSAPSASATNSASALVEAAKNGINTDDSNKDKESSIETQKVLDKKKNAAIAAGRQEQQQAQQSYDNGGDGGGGDSGGGGGGDSGSVDGSDGSDSSSASADSGQDYSGTGQSGGTAADTPATAPTSQQVMSMDELQKKVPARLAKLFPTIEAAAQKYNLQPQLLVAIAMQESTGGTDASAYSNGGGMFQFTDAGTWSEYGSGSRSDDQASAWACAKYMAACLNDSGGSLNAALREYNGPVGQGGKPSYQSDIYKKMQGIDLGN